MTIEIKGYVHSLTAVWKGEIEIVITPEASRFLENIAFNATRGEVEVYRPGMPVTISIRPTVSTTADPHAP